jgi:hypothetical protein
VDALIKYGTNSRMHRLNKALIHGRIDAIDVADAALSHEYIDV